MSSCSFFNYECIRKIHSDLRTVTLIDAVYTEFLQKKYFSDNQKRKRGSDPSKKKLALKDLINEEKAHSLSLPVKKM